jgi:DNA-binding SARP family transcriptional activator/WD40 repeat protein
VTEHTDRSGEIVNRFQFRVLGPVQVVDSDGGVVDVGGAKPRLVLVQLLLNPNRVVSTDALVDALWGDDPPPTARRSLQSHVAKLRAALGGDDGPLRSQQPGYVLVVDEAQIDLCRSENLVREARTSLLSNPRRSHLLARQAQKEWTSEPLGDLAPHDQLVPQRRRLDQLWLDLIELEVDAELAMGHTAEAAVRLESLVLDRPEHEPFWARLMTAYYRLGRQGDALLAFQRARTALVEAFGIDPSPELQRLEVSILRQTPELDGVGLPACPYKGLASYQLDDADRFYGRDDLVAELVEAVRTASFVVVVGGSGAGKSSALRAGLVRAVEAGKLSGLRQASVITPGTVPLRSIYQVPASADVVVVDQFEELFTLTDDDAIQREFVRLLLARVNETAGRIVISLRADFYGYCTRIPELTSVLARRQVVVGPLSEQELREVITKPAANAGLVVAHELVDAIVAEAANHVGALPLVSHALVETWHRRSGDQLTLEAYREAGSIAAAIARTAERVYDSFLPAQRVQAERLFLRLVEPGGGTDHSRRKVVYEQLEGSSIDREVIDVLVEARLLTAGAEGIEMAHEALIEAWPRLRSWIDDNRDGIRMHRHLTSAAIAWDELGRDEGELYRGARLTSALSWLDDAAPDLSDLERAFLDAGVGMSEAQLRQQMRSNRRLRILVAASVVGVIAAAVGTLQAISKANDADRGRREAEAAQLVVTARGQPNLSATTLLQLAVDAHRRASTPATKGLLLDAIVQDPGFTRRGDLGVQLTGHAPISSTGGVLVAIDDNVLGVVLDARTLKPRKQGLRPVPLAVVDTGSRLLGVMSDTLETIDVETREKVGPPLGVTARPNQVGLSPDGTTLAVVLDTEGQDTAANVGLYDVASGQRRLTINVEEGETVRDVMFSSDGSRLLAVVGESRAMVWDTTTGMELPFISTSGASVTRLAMSPTGTGIALGRQDGRVEMWRSDNRQTWSLVNLPRTHRESISWIDFDPLGAHMVSTSRDGMAIVWDTATGTLASRPRSFAGPGGATFFGSDSATGLVTIDGNGRAWGWDAQRDSELLTTVPGVDFGATVAAVPETRVFAAGPALVTLHDPSGGSPREIHAGSNEASILGVAASGDSARFAVAYDDGNLELRDTASGGLVVSFDQRVAVLDVRDGQRYIMIALNRRGTRVAFQGADLRLEVVNDDGTGVDPISLSPHRQSLQALDLSDDGSELVVSTISGEAIWYDLDGIDAGIIAESGTGFDAQFVSDHRVAVVGNGDARIIEPRSGHVTERFAVGQASNRLAVDGTGRLLATVDERGSVQLWDADQIVRIGEALSIRNVSSAVPIRFSDDGHYLVVGGPAETTWVDVWTEHWPLVACGLVTEGTSSAERAPSLGALETTGSCP